MYLNTLKFLDWSILATQQAAQEIHSLMPPRSDNQGDTVETDKNCVLHGDRLTRVEVLLETMKDDYLLPIREQTLKTNGRVNSLEQIATRNRAWIYFLWIALGAVAAAFGAIFEFHIAQK